jgi:hypothetical protein
MQLTLLQITLMQLLLLQLSRCIFVLATRIAATQLLFLFYSSFFHYYDNFILQQFGFDTLFSIIIERMNTQ